MTRRAKDLFRAQAPMRMAQTGIKLSVMQSQWRNRERSMPWFSLHLTSIQERFSLHLTSIQERFMSKYYSRYAFALATFVAAGVGAPLAPALAASATSPNMVDNATAGVGMGRARVTGIYDGYDQYRDVKGFPLPGWDILFFPPS
jgi:hypothetical protein